MENIINFFVNNTVFFETIGLFILGAAVCYYRCNTKLQTKAAALIAEAEQTFTAAKSGNQRFNWVVDKLYDLIPALLKKVITKDMIADVVQSTFDSMAAYAKTQVDRVIDDFIIKKD